MPPAIPILKPETHLHLLRWCQFHPHQQNRWQLLHNHHQPCQGVGLRRFMREVQVFLVMRVGLVSLWSMSVLL